MKNIVAILSAVLVGMGEGRATDGVVLEITSPYHHIRVIDKLGIRTLSFDGSMESRMSLRNPLTGHFEYIEYFHMPWLWNSNLAKVLMIGLGGASVQRAYEHYYPEVTIETAEIDPTVVRIAKEYFGFKESDRQRVHVTDGRMHLRRTESLAGGPYPDWSSLSPYASFTTDVFPNCRC